MTNPSALLEVKELKIQFPIFKGIFQRRGGTIQAVDGVSFQVQRGQTLGLVGESGCGKTTTGRAILQLYKATSGSVRFKDIELTKLSSQEMRPFRRSLQMIFQDPWASLNPRATVGEILREPFIVHKIGAPREQLERVRVLMQKVGLNPDYINRYPHQFSGGQRQRIGIARALAVEPDFIVCDEPISALDVSIQAQIVNLLQELQEQEHLTYLFISHDLSVVRHISTHVAVMYLGKIVELGDQLELYNNPLHPYTQALLSAVHIPDSRVERMRKRIILEGDLPSPANPPMGCHFCTRCPRVMDICRREQPVNQEKGAGHWVACFLQQ